ncbi:DUF523 domain-containing protein [Crassaminicella profunda]|uniref:DUF523 domain-containing protein n=1 Tax=Crassaminicella profunda TaxID=1286698 RepID=UPI001CA6761E|nr:DUF523 domain-containing protein [Crassaminicella profunda]QZY53688.1 DUF523 domain-containing protein [Crassaminicella profunda]
MYLVSACLAGVNCRYDSSNILNKKIGQLVKEGKAIAICPEMIAGLNTPRACCEMVQDHEGRKKIISNEGEDFTKEFMDGAMKTLEIIKTIGIKKAILQSRSPSCGYGRIYDGTFNGTLKEGNGLVAELLIKNGIKVYTENELERI